MGSRGECNAVHARNSTEIEEPAESLIDLVHKISGQGADTLLEISLVQGDDLRGVRD